jgi:hypothetical protein
MAPSQAPSAVPSQAPSMAPSQATSQAPSVSPSPALSQKHVARKGCESKHSASVCRPRDAGWIQQKRARSEETNHHTGRV